MCQEYKCVPLACCVRLCGYEGLHELRGVWNKVLIFAVDSVYSEYGVLADIGMTVLETAPAGGYKRFKELGIFRYLLKETKGGTADVLIWMLLQELSGETP